MKNREEKLERIVGPPWYEKINKTMEKISDKFFDFPTKFPFFSVLGFLIFMLTGVRWLFNYFILTPILSIGGYIIYGIILIVATTVIILGLIFAFWIIRTIFKHFIPEIIKMYKYFTENE